MRAVWHSRSVSCSGLFKHCQRSVPCNRPAVCILGTYAQTLLLKDMWIYSTSRPDREVTGRLHVQHLFKAELQGKPSLALREWRHTNRRGYMCKSNSVEDSAWAKFRLQCRAGSSLAFMWRKGRWGSHLAFSCITWWTERGGAGASMQQHTQQISS